MSTNYEAPHCATASIIRYFIPLRSKYSPQHPVLKHPQSMLFTPIENSWQNYGFVMFLHVALKCFVTRRQREQFFE
jgi:hypothetical protein